MENLLRGEKPSEVIPFSWEDPVLYFPIRHHSVVCAWHLERAIERYRPECILVEGPENANELVELLTDPDTAAPVAFYYSCRDEGKYLSDGEEPGFWRCYYPFLDTSPELVALRAARKMQIPGRFMDLTFAEILLVTKDERGLRTPEEKLSYASDRYLAHNRFQERLCERALVRSFEEFWEKYFEVEGLSLSTEAFVNLMNTYCLLSRRDTPEVELREDGCIAREAWMAHRIREASKTYRRILVVAGGFHIAGLIDPKQDVPTVKKHPKLKQTVYPMRYSLSAADALNGYASGMPSPGFYHQIWQELHGDNPEQAWETVILDHLVGTGRALRKMGETISAFDEACAMDLALGLASLRQKRHPGLFELQDAVLSSFVKGEATLAGLEPLRILRERTTGDRLGSLAAGALVPPLSKDFEEQCRRHRLKLTDNARQTATLSVLSDRKHREVSRFLHQTEFLDCGFAKRSRGPDLITGRDRNLIREIWEYRWSAAVDAALIEQSVAGGTVREACLSLLRSAFVSANRSEEGAELLLKGFLMGLGDQTGILSARMDALVLSDGDFASLCRACSHLYNLHQWKDAYGEGDSFDALALLNRLFDRVVRLIPSMHTVDDRGVEDVQEAAMLLYQLTMWPEFADRRPRFRDALQMLIGMEPIHPALLGAALGLLYGMDSGWKSNIDAVVRGYLRGARPKMLQSAQLLQGLFRTARDLLLTERDFLREIDLLLCELADEDFTAMLPQLRLAFSYFMPRESDRLAACAAGFHGKKTIKHQAVAAADYTRAEAVDAWAAERLDQWGGDDHGDF